jgi:hypothetical protein
MKKLTGANSIRFLITWAGIEPTAGVIDTTYLANATAQMQAFIDQGIRVYPDFHQDLYSSYLFNSGSSYSGEGAPAWIIAAGNYPKENCGVCVTWGQNVTQNVAVEDAFYDFWHNRVVSTSIGNIGIQDEFLKAATQSLAYFKKNLTSDQFAAVVGADPFNEPSPGKLDSGETSTAWESNELWSFYQKFRTVMDTAGWDAKPAMVEPNPRWNGNISLEVVPGGLNVGTLGSRYIFNAHYYDWKAQSGVLMPFGDEDGWETSSFNQIRTRATETGSPAIVSEFGFPNTGWASNNIDSVFKAMYQSLDSGVKGGSWWANAASSGPVLSGSQWQWDIYSGRHHELMNGNASKVETSGDAWNGEDFSAVKLNSTGNYVLQQDSKLFDRIYPSAVAGTTQAFAYEDRSVGTWNAIPSSMTNLSKIVGSGQYGVLVWRSNTSTAPTELHLPATFTPAATTVISDLGVSTALPAYTTSTSIAVANETGDATSKRLILTAPATAGTLHYALIARSADSDQTVLEAAKSELAAWVASAWK